MQWLLVAYFGNGVQRPVVEPVQPPKLIAHVHGDLFPGLETQIPQLQKGLVLRVLDSFDLMDDVFFVCTSLQMSPLISASSSMMERMASSIRWRFLVSLPGISE